MGGRRVPPPVTQPLRAVRSKRAGGREGEAERGFSDVVGFYLIFFFFHPFPLRARKSRRRRRDYRGKIKTRTNEREKKRARALTGPSRRSVSLCHRRRSSSSSSSNRRRRRLLSEVYYSSSRHRARRHRRRGTHAHAHPVLHDTHAFGRPTQQHVVVAVGRRDVYPRVFVSSLLAWPLAVAFVFVRSFDRRLSLPTDTHTFFPTRFRPVPFFCCYYFPLRRKIF